MIRFITYLIDRLTQYRDYLIDKSIPKSQTAKQWAAGYEKWQRTQRKK